MEREVLMTRALLVAIVLAGCTKVNPEFCPNHPDDPRCGGMMQDAGADAPDSGTITADARLDFGAGTYAIRLLEPPSGTLTLISTPLNTDSAQCLTSQVWVNSNQPAACFRVAADITIDASISVPVTGTRPLVLLAANTITISGTLDVASHTGATSGGPGSPHSSCMPGISPGMDGSGGGGGAGGTFAGRGGDGGGGNGSSNGGASAMNTVNNPLYLRAGCNGQTGATGGTGGAVGRGGGGVYIVAGNQITLAGGRINASGAGGRSGTSRGGGGGGGSGGMIVLYAPSITTDANTKLVANGGGGAGGTSTSGGGDGQDPNPGNPSVGGIGGTADSGCGTNLGGAGQASNVVAPGGPGASNCGGGGGGGGIGYIQSNVSLSAAMTSPPVTVL
jgi:hypothetical protein